MINSKLFQLYKALDTAQKRSFNKWLASPLHVQHPNIKALFEFFNRNRKITINSLSKSKAFEFIFPNQVYLDAKLRHLMSDAYESLQAFIVFKKSQNDTFRQQLYLKTALTDLKLENLAEKQLLRIKKYQEKKTIKDANYFLQNYELEQEIFVIKAKQQRTEATNLQEITATFSTFFVINTLKYACKSQTHSNLRKAAYKIPLLDAVLEEVKKGTYNSIDTVMQYYFSYQVLTAPNKEANYDALKSYLLDKSASTAIEDFKEIFIAALNFCIRKLNDGAENYVKEALLLYKEGLKKQTLIEDGILSRFSYKNIAALGLRCEEYDWTAQFIDDYAQFLQPQYRQNYQHYNHAKLAYEQKQYEKAMQLLIRVEYDDVFLNIDAKIMLMKMYYQQKNHDALYSLIESVRVFLSRKSKAVLSYHQENYSNILKYLQKIVRCNPYDKNLKQQLRMEIVDVQPLTEKKWLLDILASL